MPRNGQGRCLSELPQPLTRTILWYGFRYTANMRLPVLLLLFFSAGLLKAQIRTDKHVFDFGQIAEFNNDTAFFSVQNTGSKTIYLLSTQPEPHYALLSSGKTIAPGETLQLGIVYYTDRKGRFSFSVPVYFSSQNDPVVFTVKGHIRSIRETAFNTCPSVENSKPLQVAQIPLKILVRHAETGALLSGVRVSAKDRHLLTHCVPGYESAAYKCNTGYGPLQISAEKQGFQPASVYFTYTDQNYICEIRLNPLKDSIPLLAEKPDIRGKQARDSLKKQEPFYVPASEAEQGMNPQLYKPNHLVFVVDISGSMKDSVKLGYLKAAMKSLIAHIRPGDHISLITYASKVRVVFENYSGSDKSSIYKALDTLKAGGGSNGSKSLVEAYRLAETYFIEGGNNQVFLATDGLLNSSKMSNEDLYRMADKHYRQKDIKLTAIGFGNHEPSIEFMKKLAHKGRGNFIRILNTDADVNKLLDEVKLQSLR